MCNTVKYCETLYNTVQGCTILCNTVKYCETLYNTAKCCKILCNTVKTVQHCTTLYNIVQHCKILWNSVKRCTILRNTVKYYATLCITVKHCATLYNTVQQSALDFLLLVNLRRSIKKTRHRSVTCRTGILYTLYHTASFVCRCFIFRANQAFLSSLEVLPSSYSTLYCTHDAQPFLWRMDNTSAHH